MLTIIAGLLLACSDSDAPQEKAVTSVTEDKAVQLPAEVPAMPAAEEAETSVPVVATEEVAVQMPADVETAVEPIATVSGDKPYQIVDGKISENALNGWRTYNGGGCGTCHGKGGIGAVGPNLADSVTGGLSKEEFMDVVINGRSGTMMRPHKTNKRVMDNIEDLYIYLMARGDDVLGPGNLIKSPLGK